MSETEAGLINVVLEPSGRYRDRIIMSQRRVLRTSSALTGSELTAFRGPSKGGTLVAALQFSGLEALRTNACVILLEIKKGDENRDATEVCAAQARGSQAEGRTDIPNGLLNEGAMRRMRDPGFVAI